MKIALAYLLLTVGLVAVVSAFYWRRRTLRFMGRAVKLRGVITDLIDGTGEGSVTPRYSFRTSDGQDRTGTGTVATLPSRYAVGESVQVLFDPVTGESRLGRWLDVNSGTFALGAAGVVLVTVGFVILPD